MIHGKSGVLIHVKSIFKKGNHLREIEEITKVQQGKSGKSQREIGKSQKCNKGNRGNQKGKSGNRKKDTREIGESVVVLKRVLMVS